MSVATQIIEIVRRKVDEATEEIGHVLVSDEDMLTILEELGPVEWKKTGELEDQSYTWPEGTEHYGTFEVWEGGGLKLGVGYRDVAHDKSYFALFKMGEGGGKRPIVYFTDADDFPSTRERLSPIRGKDGGRRFFAPGEQLPPEYDGMEIGTFRDRIKGRWNVQAVVAKEDDIETMLNHTAAQIHLRHL